MATKKKAAKKKGWQKEGSEEKEIARSPRGATPTNQPLAYTI